MQIAYVLHARPYRETSLIVDFLTQSEGRVTAVSKGGRKSKGKQGLFRVFSQVGIDWIGNAELKTLKSIEEVQSPIKLTGISLFSGYYLNELIVKLLPIGLSVDQLFDEYKVAITNLARIPDSQSHTIQLILRSFEVALLHELGCWLDYSVVTRSNEPVIEGDYYYFDGENGVTKCFQQNSACLVGADLLAISNGDWQSARTLAALKKLNQQIITYLLDNKPLESRKLLLQYLSIKSS